MGLQSEWQRIEELTRAYHAAVREERDEAEGYWQERQRRLEALLNESSVAALNNRERTWLQEQVEHVRQLDASFRQELKDSQADIIGTLRTQAGNRKAAAAYKQHRE